MSATRSRARASGSDASASDNEFGIDEVRLDSRFQLSDVGMLAWLDLELQTASSLHSSMCWQRLISAHRSGKEA